MTTLLAAPVSRTQMNLSLSIVTLVKLMNCGLTPSVDSCEFEGAAKREALAARQRGFARTCATGAPTQGGARL
jgi:hypothetical protein